MEIAIIIIKICIILFFSFYFLANFQPYYEGSDAFVYGLTAIGISQGSYEITNPLLEETGRFEFVPRSWVITDSNTTIPAFNVGLPIIGSIFYSIFGYYGLFYLVPISSIALLIFSERIATRLFGSIAGLTSLLLISSNLFIVRTGTDLLTGNISVLFLLIGFFYLIKFFKKPRDSYALIISTSLIISTLIRINGLVFFPIEFILIICFFIIKHRNLEKTNQKSRLFSNYKINKKSLRLFMILLLPWIGFLIFWFSYNDYYFGDPMTNYLDVKIEMDPSIYYNTNSQSLLVPNSQTIENIKTFSQYLLPYPFSGARSLEVNYENIFGSGWLGIPPIIFLSGVLILSFFKKIKCTEIFLILVFVCGTIWFYSAVGGEIDPNRGGQVDI